MSILDSSVAKKGHSWYIAFSVASLAERPRLPPLPSPPSSSHAEIALPKPYQPGSSSRHWHHESLEGVDSRSAMRRLVLREAGREPILSSAISAIGVAEKK